jgi:CRISPR/Cas system-associated exonuclease Cas4 (RecB family)
MTMLHEILTRYFTTPPQGDQAASMLLNVATHHTYPDHSKFRVSDAGKCHRMRYWKRQGIEGTRSLTLETQLALQTGNLLHAFFEEAIQATDQLISSEYLVEDAHRIGHIDAILSDCPFKEMSKTRPNPHKVILYDFKTIGGKQAYYLKQDLSPKPEHLAQIRSYHHMYLTKRSGEDYSRIDELRIAYINRDTLEIFDLSVPMDAAAVNADWEPLIGYWDRQETPPMTKTAWECKYCQYQAQCAPGK